MSKAKSHHPEQLYIDGTAPPRNEQIDTALYAWLDSKDEQRAASERTRIRHASLLKQMADVGCDKYPFLDRSSGKKKHVNAAKETKAKVVAGPIDRDKPKGRRGREKDVDMGENGEPKPDDKVEMRRVSRKSVEQEIDGFAATRAAMNGESTPS